MSYIPTQDALAVAWVTNFDSQLTINKEAVGIETGVCGTMHGLAVALAAAYALATEPGTRTPVTVAAKDQAKTDALSFARTVAMQIQANAGVSDEIKALLGLTVRDPSRTPVLPPETYPLIAYILGGSGVCELAVSDQNTPDLKKKPVNAIGFVLFRATAASGSPARETAVFVGNFTRANIVIDTTDVTKGHVSKYWAKWYTRRGEFGPEGASENIIVS
jgi:hypothetical protein